MESRAAVKVTTTVKADGTVVVTVEPIIGGASCKQEAQHKNNQLPTALLIS